jgi:hypothetical protein
MSPVRLRALPIIIVRWEFVGGKSSARLKLRMSSEKAQVRVRRRYALNKHHRVALSREKKLLDACQEPPKRFISNFYSLDPDGALPRLCTRQEATDGRPADVINVLSMHNKRNIEHRP